MLRTHKCVFTRISRPAALILTNTEENTAVWTILANAIGFGVLQDIHLSACHIAGVFFTKADKLSRSNNDDVEWALSYVLATSLVAAGV